MLRIDRMYIDMGKPRPRPGSWEKISRVRTKFRVYTGIAMAASIVVFFLAAKFLGEYKDPQTTPLLQGPPQFILLALIVALSVYLRQVNAGAFELREKIRTGQAWNYPLRARYKVYTQEKLDALESVSEKLSIAGPLMILLFLLIASRIFTESILRYFSKTVQQSKWVFALDLVIAGWVFLTFLLLARTHFSARKRDDEIRAVAKDFEGEILAAIESGVTTQTESRPESSGLAVNVTAHRASANQLVYWSTIVAALLLFVSLAFQRSREDR
jgi:uncharacterized integral membrane protein